MASPPADRRDRLRELLADRDVDAVLVTDLLNVRYLTGFTGSNGAVLVTESGSDVLATDARYTTQAAAECPDVELVIERRCAPVLAARATADGIRRLGIETHALSVDRYDEVSSAVADGATVGSAHRPVEQLRMRKDDDELAALTTACAVSCQALEALLAGRITGRSEREIARDLEWRMYAGGADAVGFATIVAAGPNSAVPHHRPTGRVVEAGDLLKVDFGAAVAGYHADCTRTVVVGPPAGWQREVHAVVAAAQRAGREALVPGAALAVVDAAARDVVTAAGHGDAFTHGLGHGVGLAIHEDPFLAARADGRLAERTAVTVEPGVYLPGRGGVRIEDTLVVQPTGPTLLTPTTRDLLVVD